MSVHKKIQPNRSSRLAGYMQHIYIYNRLVLLYRLFKITHGDICSFKHNFYSFIQRLNSIFERIGSLHFYDLKKNINLKLSAVFSMDDNLMIRQ